MENANLLLESGPENSKRVVLINGQAVEVGVPLKNVVRSTYHVAASILDCEAGGLAAGLGVLVLGPDVSDRVRVAGDVATVLVSDETE
jgi:hypothetical protein